MTETTKRIIQLKEKMGLNDHQLEIGAGLKPAFLQAWKNGKKNSKGEIVEVKPSTDSITKLARYFNVSADYLLCLTDEPKPLENREIAERQTTALSTEFAELSQDKDFVDTAKLYKEMPKPDRRAICAYVIGLAQGVLGMAKVNQILGRYL